MSLKVQHNGGGGGGGGEEEDLYHTIPTCSFHPLHSAGGEGSAHNDVIIHIVWDGDLQPWVGFYCCPQHILGQGMPRPATSGDLKGEGWMR